jgi:hypothetical protein
MITQTQMAKHAKATMMVDKNFHLVSADRWVHVVNAKVFVSKATPP